MRSFTITLQPGMAALETCVGKVLTVKKCTLPLVVNFDGANQRTVKAGSVVPTDGFKNLNFLNNQAVAVTITFEVADTAGQYTADDNAASNAASYAFGNLGVVTGAGAAGGLPACDGNGFLQITNAMALVVAGTNNGHRRQIITFSMAGNSPSPLNLLDANGLAFMTILSGQQIMLVTDAAFTLSGAGGTAWVTVGQIFLSA